ncbi:hypothetical protein PCASD_02254 [Puccinia coronata f. sp. avenae]|uniref:Uncharacterized protein n=1 Tax=Puccinia coronata f. sp. avenae TaxID=200324 RepID=A0A2N5VI63_9BASI|nr:hypothetical protein PCASD_02254 [Puccinia coronata f. sp. avenae]
MGKCPIDGRKGFVEVLAPGGYILNHEDPPMQEPHLLALPLPDNRILQKATDVTSVAQTDFMSAGPTDTLEQRHNVSVGPADVTSVW